jgi:hypothetical protein
VLDSFSSNTFPTTKASVGAVQAWRQCEFVRVAGAQIGLGSFFFMIRRVAASNDDGEAHTTSIARTGADETRALRGITMGDSAWWPHNGEF